MADYAISNVPRRVVYAPSGVGPYAFTFEILDQTDIAVYRGSTLLTLTTDYTVTINLNGTGSVTLVTTAGTSNITIVGAKNIQRTTDFTTGGDLFANTLNDELDNQTIFIQQVAETAERGLKAPVVDPTDINMTLPAKASRVGTVLAFNATTGNPEAGPSIASVTTVAAQSANINTVATNIASVNAVAGNSTNINTVAGISGNVTTVAGSIANVNAVGADLLEPTSEINTVAVNIANVNTVGNEIAYVIDVAQEIGPGQDVTVVATNLAGTNTIGTVATNIANINAVGNNIANVNTVAGINPDVTTVATNVAAVSTVSSNIANVNTVANISASVTLTAGNETNITTVATNIANVNSVGANIANVNSVAGNATNINTVAGISANVTTVAGISGNVTTVATNNANVTTVAGSIANVNTVAGNIANVNQVAADTVAINAASANATAAAASATAAAGSATSASASAAAASAVALGNEPVRHSVRPSLLLDFANTKTLDPRITFTRASTGTFYDGKTVAKAEENLQTYSQEFDNGAWTKTNTTVTANSTAAPDGTTTADTLTPNTTTGYHTIYGSTVPTSSGTATHSFYIKANGYTKLAIRENVTNGYYACFDLTAVSVLDQTATFVTNASITSVGNGWYRIVCTISNTTAHATSLWILPASYTTGNPVSTTWAGDGTSGVFIWGAQLEQRSSVTAYTATTTAPITNYIPALQTAAAGVARFEHNPVTGESLGLEIEEQRTNLLTYSEQFNDASWTKVDATVLANATIAPDGTLTADKLVEGTGTDAKQVYKLTTITAAAHTFSFYAKAAERSFCTVYFDPSFSVAYINLATGTVATNASGYTIVVTPVGNGWYRIAATRTGTAAGWITAIEVATGDGVRAYTGDGYSGIYIWGAQLEAGAFATSYIPTVASQVTRSADSASMTGTNFSSWYRADEGTIYTEASIQAATGIYGFTYLGDGTNSNYLDIRTQAGVVRTLVTSNGTSYANISSGAYSTGVGFKASSTYKLNDFAISKDGASTTTDTNGVVPNGSNTLLIGQLVSSATTMTGTIKKLAYYPARLTNAELQGLTTV